MHTHTDMHTDTHTLYASQSVLAAARCVAGEVAPLLLCADRGDIILVNKRLLRLFGPVTVVTQERGEEVNTGGRLEGRKD